ncbi:MAG: hypothetical protein OIN86_09715 [Candidatus Methanoperedens sp.]|nr:hypothetical protein [Candidatus Methanoperedens sp.]CAG0981395.1 hypothetical protein METP1_01795 [Methanosarcinales archaeon]
MFTGERHLRQDHYSALTLLFLIYCLFPLPSASGHSPIISGYNSNLDEAMFIPDPTKSWAIYGELHGEREIHYYRFEIEKGQRIYISLMKPTNEENKEFMPVFVLAGPGLIGQGTVPDYVELPAGAGAVVVAGRQPEEATYEPFSASSFYELAELDIPAPESGSFYMAVYVPGRGGHYSLALGEREVYSLAEWILIPLSLISIYQWEGQSLLIIFLPIAATLAISMGFMLWWRKKWIPVSLFEWTGMLAGLLFMGTGFMVLFQMVLALSHTHLVSEVVITSILALLSILPGIAVIRIIRKNRKKVDIRKRIYLVILGIIALFVWSGFLVGPVLAVLASLMPDRK